MHHFEGSFLNSSGWLCPWIHISHHAFSACSIHHTTSPIILLMGNTDEDWRHCDIGHVAKSERLDNTASYTAMQLNSAYLQSTGQLWSASSTGLGRCPLLQDWASQCWCPCTDRCPERPPSHGPVLSAGHHWWTWGSSLVANTQNLANVTACIGIIEAAQGL